MRNSTCDRERSNSCASNGSAGSLGGGGGASNLSNRPHSGCDIVKAGYLHIKRPPTNGAVKLRIKTWQKRYLVLRDQSYDSGTARLDIYTTESGWQEGDVTRAECYSIDLATVSHVDEYTDSKSYPNAFTITRTDHGPLVLGAETDPEAKEWIVALQLLAEKLKCARGGGAHLTKPDPNRRPSCPSRLTHWNSASQLHTADVMNNNNNSDIGAKNALQVRLRTNSQSNLRVLKLPSTIPACQDCLVKVQGTEGSKRNRLSGEYNMIVQDNDIVLRRPSEMTDVIRWPIGNIRKFKSEDLSDGWNLVTLDANVRCGNRSGTFLFRTAFGRKLIQKVKESLKQQAGSVQDSEKNLDKLRNRRLNKAPSTPNLTNRASPPKIVISNNENCTPRKERIPSNPDEDPKPKCYLELLPEEKRDSFIDAGEYIDDQIIQEPAAQPATAQCTDNSAKPAKRPSSGLPPLPPPPISAVSASSLPPPPSASSSTSSSSSSSSSSLSSSDGEPPELPPRRPSCSPPSPPPRPQHTLSTNSLPVSNSRQ